ncbi:MAG: ribosome-associated translation inhibitor RaiA [Elusimicrobia bacterium]|nr:ribosome-associated translation inhibitor RaiA [Elusimicrobiota bacterium]
MKIHVTGRHLRLTPAIRDYVEAKIAKAEKYFDHIVWAQVTLSVEKRSHQAEIVIHAPRQTFRALAGAATLYAAIDLASDKIDGQLRKHKERIKNRHKPGESAAEVVAREMDPRPVRFSVIKEVPMSPMTAEEAASEMERIGFTFWMFHDKDSDDIHVIYRRQDDSFGLLQPARKAER